MQDSMKKATGQLLAGKKPIPQATQGEIEGPKGRDAVPLWGEDGEYVLPSKVVQAMGGAEALDAMVEQMTGQKPGGQPVQRDNSVFLEGPGHKLLAGLNPGGKPESQSHDPLRGRALLAGVTDDTMGFNRGGAVGDYMRKMGDAWAADNAKFESGNPGFMARAGRAINPLTGLGSAIGAARTAAQDGDLAGVGVAALGGLPAFGAMRAPVKGVSGMMSPGVDAARSAMTIGVNTAANVAGDYYDGSAPPAARLLSRLPQQPEQHIFKMAEEMRRPTEKAQGFKKGGRVGGKGKVMGYNAGGLLKREEDGQEKPPAPVAGGNVPGAPGVVRNGNSYSQSGQMAGRMESPIDARSTFEAFDPGVTKRQGPRMDSTSIAQANQQRLWRTGGADESAPKANVPTSAALLGQPEPNPNAGSAWKDVGNALTHSSDRAAMEQRQVARDETLRASGRFGLMPAAPNLDAGVNLGFLQNTLQDFERTNGVNNIGSQNAGSGGAEIGRIEPTATNTSVPGVTRYDRPGESPLFSNVPSGGMAEGGTAARTTDSPEKVDRLMQRLAGGNGIGGPSAMDNMHRAIAAYQDRNAALAGGNRRSASGGGIANPDISRREQQARDSLRNEIIRQATTRIPGARGITARQSGMLASLMQMDDGMQNARASGLRADAELDARQSESQARLGFDARRLGLDEQAQAQRMQTDTARLGFDARRLGLDERRFETEDRVRGFEARGLERMENLYQQLDKAETPEARASIAEQIRAISGRDAAEGAWKPVSLQGGTDSMGNKTESVLAAVNSRTGEMRRYDGGAQQGDISTDRRAIEIRDNPNMTRDQKVAALRALGYS